MNSVSSVCGFLSLLFLSIGFAVALPLSHRHWDSNRRLAMIWTIVATACAIIGVGTGAVFYFYPPPAIIQTTIGPPEKQYTVISTETIDDLVVGQMPMVTFNIENGPGEATLNISDITFRFTNFVPETTLTYKKGANRTAKMGPHQKITLQCFSTDAKVLTKEDIAELNAEPPTAQLFMFTRGSYSNETGAHPFDICRRYDKKFPTHIVFCEESIKIE